jgi:hypothetical protein
MFAYKDEALSSNPSTNPIKTEIKVGIIFSDTLGGTAKTH